MTCLQNSTFQGRCFDFAFMISPQLIPSLRIALSTWETQSNSAAIMGTDGTLSEISGKAHEAYLGELLVISLENLED